MATIDTSTPARYAEMYGDYDGFSSQTVGLGTVPGMYASDEYAAKKTDTLLIGIPSKSIYISYDTDPNPTIIPLVHESAINCVLGVNIRYCPQQIRQQIMTYILKTNEARIRSGAPIICDWHSLAKAVPAVRAITRRYKLSGLRVVESIGLDGLPQVINERSPFENVYKQKG